MSARPYRLAYRARPRGRWLRRAYARAERRAWWENLLATQGCEVKTWDVLALDIGEPYHRSTPKRASARTPLGGSSTAT